MRRRLIVRGAAASLAAVAVGSVLVLTTADAAAARAACVSGGPSGADYTTAAALNRSLTKTLAGHLNGYRVSCARRIVAATRAAGLNQRAAVIAVTTSIVEATLQNLSTEVDHTSLGLFQQQSFWGSRPNRLDPAWATNAFLGKLRRTYPNNTWNNGASDAAIGAICQKVQVSSFPEKYAKEVSDARKIVAALWTGGSGGGGRSGVDTTGYYNPADGTFHLSNTNGATARSAQSWGTAWESVPGAQILVGDWNGNRTVSTGYYNPADGTFHLSNNNATTARSALTWGTNWESVSRAQILVGDWDGNGTDTSGYYNPADGTFHLSNTNGASARSAAAWNTAWESVPRAQILVGDWDGNGVDTTGYYNPADGTFHLSNTNGASARSAVAWNTAWESVPRAQILVGDWNGDGVDSTGYYNPADGTFHLSNTNGAAARSAAAWGTNWESVAGARIVVGDWNGA